MRFLNIFTPDAKFANTPPSPEHMEKMGRLMEESIKAGTLVTTGGLLPLSKGGARVLYSGGQFTVNEGPSLQGKELVEGFAILEAGSQEEAIELVRNFHRVAGEGESTLQQILDAPCEDLNAR